MGISKQEPPNGNTQTRSPQTGTLNGTLKREPISAEHKNPLTGEATTTLHLRDHFVPRHGCELVLYSYGKVRKNATFLGPFIFVLFLALKKWSWTSNHLLYFPTLRVVVVVIVLLHLLVLHL